MSEALAATPGSTADSSGLAKTPATKDRTCPFCQAPFTSSSLGRHLDLYIKDKNPKPPDDVHDVEEIRKLRGSVTRRQARTSSAKREDSTTSSSKPTPIPEQRSPSNPAFYSGVSRTLLDRANWQATGNINNASNVEGSPMRTILNRANWQATGVINNIPPPIKEGSLTGNKRRTVSRNASIKETLTRKHDALEERDRGRAAELALQEALESVRAANARAHPRSPFEFNWFSQSFPAICLRCLSAPLPLLSVPSVPNQASWPMEPPGLDQYQDLELWLESKLVKWKQKQDALSERDNQKTNGVNGHTMQHRQLIENGEEKEVYVKHLSSIYQSWKGLSEKQRLEVWRLELQQALVREQESHHQAVARLDRAEQEIQHLRAQLSQRGSYQQASEFSDFPPSTMPLSREALDVLIRDRDLLDWDYEALISKWKTRIQNNRNIQQPLSNVPVPNSWSQILDTGSFTNGTSHHIQPRHDDLRSHQNNGIVTDHDLSEDDEDLADAPGDDDEDMHVQNHTPRNTMMDRRVLDPHLRDHTDSILKDNNTSAGGGGVEGYGARALTGFREYGRNMGNNGDL